MSIDFRKVCSPLLPSASEIASYLETLDRTRWYTNRGHLVQELETRLSRCFGTQASAPDVVVTTATGTAALEAAILATSGRATAERPLALLPSYTFAATALAAERCGYQPFFLDIDPETWALDPDLLLTHPAAPEAGVIVAVAPYGRLPDMRALERVQARLGVPVVVDGAAAFEQVLGSPEVISDVVPIAVSFHATKTFSTGEGGAVLWRNQEGRELICQATNFGFLHSRECRMAGFNGKMSEYHAAVGHAMLDRLEVRLTAYEAVAADYKAAVAAHALPGTLFVGGAVSSAYALFLAETVAEAQALRDGLQASRVGWRRWYEEGLHAMSHFAGCRADPLPVTADISARLIGLPMAPDLSPGDIARVVQTLSRALPPARAHDPLHAAVPGQVLTFP